jgi:hypothetical protein
MLSRRVGGLAGLSFIAIVVSVNIILGATGMPRPGASASEVQTYFADHGDVVAFVCALATFVWLCLGVFGAGLVARLRQEDAARVESWPLLGLGGVIMQNCLFAGVVATQGILATATLSDDSRWLVWQLHNALFALNGTSLAIILLSFSVAGVRSGLIRRWHAGVGLTAAVVLQASSLTMPWHEENEAVASFGLLGFVLWLVWVATYSLVLLRGTPATGATSAERRTDPALATA